MSLFVSNKILAEDSIGYIDDIIDNYTISEEDYELLNQYRNTLLESYDSFDNDTLISILDEIKNYHALKALVQKKNQEAYDRQKTGKVKYMTYDSEKDSPEKINFKRRLNMTPEERRQENREARSNPRVKEVMGKYAAALSNAKTEEEKNQIRQSFTNGARQVARNAYGSLSMSYNPVGNQIMINKAASRNLSREHGGNARLARHQLLGHELRHKEQFDYARDKYGENGVKKLLRRAGIGGVLKADGTPDNDKYFRIPTEYDAHMTGSRLNGLRDRSFKTQNLNRMRSAVDSMMKQKTDEEYRNNLGSMRKVPAAAVLRQNGYTADKIRKMGGDVRSSIAYRREVMK